jgi:methyl-accepting chemotaxis protein
MPPFKLRLSLAQKILAISALGILGLVTVGGINFAGQSMQERYRASAAAAQRLFSLTGELSLQLLEARRAEKDFLLRADVAYTKRHEDLSKAIVATLVALQAQALEAKLGELRGNIDSIRDGYDAYLTHFGNLVASRIKLGLNEKLGLEGTLRQSVHEIEQTLKQFSTPQLMVLMLMLRRHEKDFMLRRDARYGEEFKKRVGEFTKALDAADLPAAARADISQKLAAYQRDFLAWMDEAQVTAAEQKATSGAYAAVSPVIDAVKAAVEKAYAEAEAAERTSRTETTRRMLIATLTVVLIVSLFGFLIGRVVSNRLKGMTGAMTELASGNLGVDVPGRNSRDEIGAMAKAVLVFRDAAVENNRLEQEAEKARALTEAERAAREAERMEEARQAAAVIAALADGLDRVARGDLLCQIHTSFPAHSEKLRTDFNAAVDKLKQTMLAVVVSTQSIHSRTQEISAASDDLSSRTERQSASLEETAAALEQITATVNKAAQGATHARAVVAGTKNDAEKSDEVVRAAVEAMGGIEKSSQQISQIIGVIDEIAFQTNLLALNAGVEAARAGDAGRGFAVVASEVRALAQRSAEAAKEIKGLISTSTGQVQRGVELVAETGKALARIMAKVTEVNSAVGEIAAGAQEQATGLQQVNVAVNQMDQVTQQNAAMAEEATAASRALAHESDQLSRLVAQFQVDPQAAARPSAIRAAA